MFNHMTFDIETVPDVASGRAIYQLEDLDDKAVAEVMLAKRREMTNGNSDFLPPNLHRIVAISVVLRQRDTLKVWSLGDEDSSEAELVQRFFAGIERFTPTLISWNGSGFDLPVLNYRALLHGIPAPRYWDMGDDDRDFRYNNYHNRYHLRHTDLMDVLGGFSQRAPLDQVAQSLGFPGKLGMHGSEVMGAWLDGGIREIRNYCESDVLNTWLVYLRWALLRGQIDQEGHEAELNLTRKVLQDSGEAHHLAFLAAWKALGKSRSAS